VAKERSYAAIRPVYAQLLRFAIEVWLRYSVWLLAVSWRKIALRWAFLGRICLVFTGD
jgi:hypothetical protein